MSERNWSEAFVVLTALGLILFATLKGCKIERDHEYRMKTLEVVSGKVCK